MSVDKTTSAEKVLRIAIPALLIYGGIKVFNMFAPELIEFFSNVWRLVFLGVPFAALFAFVATNPKFIWMQYTTLIRKIVSFFIKLDPLSFMERYVDLLIKKKANLDKIKTNLSAKKVALERKIEESESQMEENIRLGKAAVANNNKERAGYYGELVQGNKESLRLYEPIYTKMEHNLTFLNKLSENWGYSIEKLRATIERKRTEFETLRDAAKALNQATDFINGETEEGKIYKESIIALEQSVSEKIAYIDEFEKNAKGILDQIDLERTANRTEGLDALQDALGDKLLLPSEWLNVTPVKPVFSNNYETLLK